MKQFWHDLGWAFTFSFAFTVTLLIAIAYLKALLAGNEIINIHINTYGEGWIEFVLFCGTAVGLFYIAVRKERAT